MYQTRASGLKKEAHFTALAAPFGLTDVFMGGESAVPDSSPSEVNFFADQVWRVGCCRISPLLQLSGTAAVRERGSESSERIHRSLERRTTVVGYRASTSSDVDKCPWLR
jgi:hypothetical protein